MRMLYHPERSFFRALTLHSSEPSPQKSSRLKKSQYGYYVYSVFLIFRSTFFFHKNLLLTIRNTIKKELAELIHLITRDALTEANRNQ